MHKNTRSWLLGALYLSLLLNLHGQRSTFIKKDMASESTPKVSASLGSTDPDVSTPFTLGDKRISGELLTAQGEGFKVLVQKEIGAFKLNMDLRPKPRPTSHHTRRYPVHQLARTAVVDPIRFSQVPNHNWRRVTASRLNLRDEPGVRNSAGETRILAKISRGARMAVTGARYVNGETWYQVMPMDCNRVVAGPGVDPNLSADLCNRTYWASGNYLQQSEAPARAEIERRVRPPQESATCTGNCGETVAATPVSISTRNAPADLATLNETAGQVADITQHISSRETLDHAQLLEAFDVARKEYFQIHPPPRRGVTQAYGGTHREAFVRHLIERMGLKNASLAVMALTMYGEAGGSSSNDALRNSAEMAAVGVVINNRAVEQSHGRDSRGEKRTRALNALNLDPSRFDLGSVEAKRIGAILAGSQFQPWFKTAAGNIDHMIGANKDKLLRAFQTASYLESGQITPLGKLARADARHFVAPYSNPSWRRRSKNKKIASVQVQTPWGVTSVKSQYFYYGVP